MNKFLLITFSLTVVVVFSLFFSPSPIFAADTLYFLHTDHLGSTRVVTDKTGAVVAKYDYYPYGSINYKLLTNNYPPTERLYTSQISDESTDLYFYNARYYNPQTGNFISADPAQGPNRYVYVAGNPINKIDPSGNEGLFTWFQKVATSFVSWMSVKDPAGQANLVRLSNEGKFAVMVGKDEAQGEMNRMGLLGGAVAHSLGSSIAAAGPISSVPDVVNSRGQYDYKIEGSSRLSLHDYVESGLDLIRRGEYEAAVTHFRSSEGVKVARSVGRYFDSTPRVYLLTDTPSPDEAIEASHIIAQESQYGFDNKMIRISYAAPLSDDVVLPPELVRNVALVHAEEWVHALQDVTGHPLAGFANFEVDVGQYLLDRGVPLTDEFLARYMERGILSAQ